MLTVSSLPALNLFFKAFVNLILWHCLCVLLLTHFLVVLYLEDVSTDSWVAESLVKAVVETDLSVLTGAVWLAGVTLDEASRVLMDGQIILLEMFFSEYLLLLLVNRLNSLIIWVRFLLVDFLHCYIKVLALRWIAVALSILVLKAHLVGALTVTGIAAFSVFSKAVIVIVTSFYLVLLWTFLVRSDKEFLADGWIAGSVALSVLQADLSSLTHSINLARLITLGEAVIFFLT